MFDNHKTSVVDLHDGIRPTRARWPPRASDHFIYSSMSAHRAESIGELPTRYRKALLSNIVSIQEVFSGHITNGGRGDTRFCHFLIKVRSRRMKLMEGGDWGRSRKRFNTQSYEGRGQSFVGLVRQIQCCEWCQYSQWQGPLRRVHSAAVQRFVQSAK